MMQSIAVGGITYMEGITDCVNLAGPITMYLQKITATTAITPGAGLVQTLLV